MNLKQAIALAGVAISMVCVSSCKLRPGLGKGPGAGHGYGRRDPRVFEVYIYTDPSDSSKCLADWPVGTLWQGKHQTVEWFSDDGGAYTVDFSKGSHAGSKSPFADTTFQVPSGGSKPSGDLQQGATGYYDFAIFSGTNPKPCKDASDPGYYIKP